MQTIIGQNKIKALFAGYTLATMPKTILFIGEQGSGKSYLIQKLAKHLGLDTVAITNQTTAEELIEYSQAAVAKLYCVDLGSISEKAQNKFLKFIEEPSNSVYIVLEAESEVGILPTILNRCLKITLEPYTLEELQSFSWAPKNADPIVYRFYNTPGKLNNLTAINSFDALSKLCSGILEYFPKQPKMDYANAMSIALKVNGKKEDASKFDLSIFLDVFIYTAFEHYKSTNQNFSFIAYRYAIEQKQKILNKTITREAFMLSFLDHLWEAAHDIT
jgi:tRNA A37 threonylcarbamoyladenosine biosynthesis protein TsaE